MVKTCPTFEVVKWSEGSHDLTESTQKWWNYLFLFQNFAFGTQFVYSTDCNAPLREIARVCANWHNLYPLWVLLRPGLRNNATISCKLFFTASTKDCVIEFTSQYSKRCASLKVTCSLNYKGMTVLMVESVTFSVKDVISGKNQLFFFPRFTRGQPGRISPCSGLVWWIHCRQLTYSYRLGRWFSSRWCWWLLDFSLVFFLGWITTPTSRVFCRASYWPTCLCPTWDTAARTNSLWCVSPIWAIRPQLATPITRSTNVNYKNSSSICVAASLRLLWPVWSRGYCSSSFSLWCL